MSALRGKCVSLNSSLCIAVKSDLYRSKTSQVRFTAPYLYLQLPQGSNLEELVCYYQNLTIDTDLIIMLIFSWLYRREHRELKSEVTEGGVRL